MVTSMPSPYPFPLQAGGTLIPRVVIRWVMVDTLLQTDSFLSINFFGESPMTIALLSLDTALQMKSAILKYLPMEQVQLNSVELTSEQLSIGLG